ncbi:MAG: YqcI/YcgG family protein [Phycisphaerales bacterium]
MISTNQIQRSEMVSDRIFRPDPAQGLSAEWDDPMGLNAPHDSLRDRHHRLRVMLENDPEAHPRAHNALVRRAYRVAQYHGLGTSESIADAEQDLRWFASAQSLPADTALVLIFEDQSLRNDCDIEHQFWSQMMGMYARDAAHHCWQPDFQQDPNETEHAFCINGTLLDLTFLHPCALHARRRFDTPTLIAFRHQHITPESLRFRARATQRQLDAPRDAAPQPVGTYA